MSDAWDYLVTVNANDGTQDVVLRYATCAYVTRPTDEPANTRFAHVVSDPGQVVRSLYTPGRTRGSATSDPGFVKLVLTPETENLLGYALDGRELVVERIDRRQPYSTAEVAYRAIMEGANIDLGNNAEAVRIRLYDRRLALEKPLQENRFSGETTSGGIEEHLADGTEDQANDPKPLVFGSVANIPLPLVNPFDGIYQANDGETASIALYDGGVTLTDIGDFDSLVLLWENHGTIKFPKFGTHLAGGYAMPFGAMFYKATANVVEGASIDERCASAVVQRMLDRAGFGETDLDLDSFEAFADTAPEEVGIWIDDDRTILAAIDEVLESVGGYIVPDLLGRFSVGRLLAPGGTPAWEIGEHEVFDEVSVDLNPDFDKNLPVWRVTVRYLRNWAPLSEAEVVPSVSGDRRSFLLTKWREAVAEDESLHALHPEATELVVETCLTTQEDAQAEAERLLELYGVDRYAVTITVSESVARAAVLGSSGKLTLDLDAFRGGRDLVVVGRIENFAQDSVTLTLWG